MISWQTVKLNENLEIYVKPWFITMQKIDENSNVFIFWYKSYKIYLTTADSIDSIQMLNSYMKSWVISDYVLSHQIEENNK